MDKKDKKDLNVRMTDVEEVSFKNCYGLKRNQTDGNANQKRKEATLSEDPANTKYFAIPLEGQQIENSDYYERRIFNILSNILGQSNSQEKFLNLETTSTNEFSKIRKAVVEDLEKYADFRAASLEDTYRILTEMDNEMNDILHLISCKSDTTKTIEYHQSTSCKNPIGQSTRKHEDNSSDQSNDQGTATAKFIEFLQMGKKDRIINCLKKMRCVLEKQKMKPTHLVALNYAVEKMCNGETLLHIGLKFDETIEFTKAIMEICPKLLLKNRSNQPQLKSGFEGQTPLHVAIARDNYKAVQNILTVGKKYKLLPELLRKESTGYKFRRTVLLGQLPLTVAALVCKNDNFKIIKTLLKNGAEIWWRNDFNDTVFHSLIQYADIFPSKMPNLQATFKFLWEEYSNSEKDPTYRCKDESTTDLNSTEYMDEQKSNGPKNETTEKKRNVPPYEIDAGEKEENNKPENPILWKNNNKLTPLHLAAKLGVSELFEYIVDIQYRYENIQDGLFDIRKYDVTEFDRLIDYKEKSQKAKKLTVLERLFDPQCSHREAFQLLNLELIAFILHKKWIAYRIPLFVWMILHFFFMIMFTASIIIKAEVLFCSQLNQTFERCDKPSSEALIRPFTLYIFVIVIDSLVGVTYLIFFCLCVKNIKDRCFSEPGNSGLIYHNLDYVVCFLVIGIGALMEVFLIPLRVHFDFHLFPALLCGWYFMLYFAPFSKNLVSFTYMIKKGFLEDFFPFTLVFIYLLVSFTGIMHMLYLGTEETVDEFYTFQDSLFTMFNLGVGLNTIDVLSKARIPWLAYTVFVVFAILSFIHLFNAFIAVMSQTFSDVHTDKHSYHKYNKLRMIELFEDILMNGVFECFNCLEKAKHWKTDGNHSKERNKGFIKQDNNSKHRQNVNDRHKREGKKDEKAEGWELEEIYDRKRYYTIMHLLDDPSDDIDEREERKIERESKLKNLYRIFQHDKNSRRSRKHKPEPADITYIQVDYANRATQFPDMKVPY
ncbi:transient receptor potential cation channel subfamily V member 3-like [Crassostrea virginica]